MRFDGVRPHWAPRLYKVLLESLRSWVKHRDDSKGAALAFYTLFSMMPILLLATIFAGYFFGVAVAQSEVIAQVQGVVGANGAQVILSLLSARHDPVSGWLAILVASVLLLLAATSVFAELKESLDELWEVAQPRQASWAGVLKTRLLSFGMVVVLAVLLLVSLLFSAALTLLGSLSVVGLGSIALVLASGSHLISFVVMVALFAIIYKTLPDVPLTWRDVWIGAVFTAILFSAGKYVIGWYLYNSGVAANFGVAGSLIALLLWIYYSAQIFFLGAEFTRHYAQWFGSLSHTYPQPSADVLAQAIDKL